MTRRAEKVENYRGISANGARKTPSQERSRVLVESLLRATARIFLQEGWRGLTTNRVAREAGVSIGSLYQYFPNKDAMVRALVEDLAERMGDELVALGSKLRDASIEEAIAVVVHAALEYSRTDAPLHRALLLELPRIGALETFERMNRRVVDTLAEWISARREEFDVVDPSLTAHVIVTALDGLTDHALLFRPELLESARFERELRTMVAGCLGVRRTVPHTLPGRKRRGSRRA